MPTYEYICRYCQQFLNVMATIKEKEEGLNPSCPECGSNEVRQSFSGVFFAMKGAGSSSSYSSSSGSSSSCGSCQSCK
ncbi:FmdB family zinc ribbon protein [Candidatus Hakubella thermalkaliphila]|uniref:FmdB family zinc ribbon protein n=1 Tax=Candidatus Hakubella thermalkaliphila TaxID=2754717 RepID=UPI0015948D13